MVNRQELTAIIEKDGGNNWWKPELFELKTKSLLPSELQIVSGPPKHGENYNCFVFAFGLQGDTEFLGGKNPVQQEFVKHLILNRILLPIETPSAGDLVFYKNKGGEITHGGVMQDKDIVISKWMWGPMTIHKLLDVPASFGDEISFFKSPEAKEIAQKYTAYKNTGIEIRPIS